MSDTRDKGVTAEELVQHIYNAVMRGESEDKAILKALKQYANQEAKGLLEAMAIALTEIKLWRDTEECDCEAPGHQCGLPRLRNSIQSIERTLSAFHERNSQEKQG